MNDKIILSDSFESFEKILFGFSQYHQDTGLKSLNQWKERVLKISKALKLAIEQNLTSSDRIHQKAVLFQINLLIDEINSAPNTDIIANEIIIKLSKIIFLLLGDMPNNYSRVSKKLPIKWKLNRYRTLRYLTTENKKQKIIFKHLEKKWDKERVQLLHEKLTLEMDADYKRFNNWFKENHSDIYNDLFYA